MAFKAEEDSILKLFNKTVFLIPRNQRKYVWNKTNWQELYDDISYNYSKDHSRSHFLGSFVFKDECEESGLQYYTIIDGQQRITTLVILLATLAKVFYEENMQSSFMGVKQFLEYTNLENEKKLIYESDYHEILERVINEIIKEQEQRQKVALKVMLRKCPNVKINRLVKNCFEFFYDIIHQEMAESKDKAAFLNNLRNALLGTNYVKIVSSSEEDSYTIFEILNARGEPLEDHELLKNYVMRYISPSRSRDMAKKQWDELEERLGNNLKSFIQHYTIHKFGLPKKREVYRRISVSSKRMDKKELLDDLILKSQYYTRLVDPVTSFTKEECSALEHKVFSFFKKSRQTQFRPVMLGLIEKNETDVIEQEKYDSILENLYLFYVCYNIIGGERANNLEDGLKKYANEINNDNADVQINKFVDYLSSKLPSLEWFKNVFNNVGWSNHAPLYKGETNKERTKLILEIIEKHLCPNREMGEYTIEHVLPDSEGEGEGEGAAQIGNLLPLEETLNRRCANKPLKEKLEIYKLSSYNSTRRFAEIYSDPNKKFNPKERTRLQAELIFNKILRIEQL